MKEIKNIFILCDALKTEKIKYVDNVAKEI